MFTELETRLRNELIRYLVQRAIFCPLTGQVLDYRTCTVLLDADGDPVSVYAPIIAERAKDMSDFSERLDALGYTLMER